MKKFCGILFVLCVSAFLQAQTPGLYLQFGRWSPDVSGNTTTSVHDALDVAQDLALDHDAPSFFSAKLFGEKHVFSYSVWKVSLSENNALDDDLIYDGVTYPAGQIVSSSLETEYQEFMYRYIFIQNLFVKVGGVLAYQHIDSKFSLEGSTHEETFSMPAVGLSLLATTPRSKAYGDVVALYGKKGDSDGTLLRAEGGLDVTSKLGIFVGVQRFDMTQEFSETTFDWTFTGVYAGVYLHL